MPKNREAEYLARMRDYRSRPRGAMQPDEDRVAAKRRRDEKAFELEMASILSDDPLAEAHRFHNP